MHRSWDMWQQKFKTKGLFCTPFTIISPFNCHIIQIIIIVFISLKSLSLSIISIMISILLYYLLVCRCNLYEESFSHYWNTSGEQSKLEHSNCQYFQQQKDKPPSRIHIFNLLTICFLYLSPMGSPLWKSSLCLILHRKHD